MNLRVALAAGRDRRLQDRRRDAGIPDAAPFDEVSCVIDDDKGACCAKYKSHKAKPKPNSMVDPFSGRN